MYGLQMTPEEQLTKSASDTAKTPLQIAGSVAGFLSFFAPALKGEPAPERRGGTPPALETREDAIAAVDGAFRRLEQAILELTDEDLAREVPVPWGGTISVATMITFALGSCLYFQGQLNYTQTIYGDLDPHIPEAWKPKQA